MQVRRLPGCLRGTRLFHLAPHGGGKGSGSVLVCRPAFKAGWVPWTAGPVGSIPMRSRHHSGAAAAPREGER